MTPKLIGNRTQCPNCQSNTYPVPNYEARTRKRNPYRCPKCGQIGGFEDFMSDELAVSRMPTVAQVRMMFEALDNVRLQK